MLIACQKQGKTDSVNCRRESSWLLRRILLRGSLSQASSVLPGKCSGCTCPGMSLAVDAWSAAALQQPRLIHHLKLGMKTWLQPTNTENLHDQPLYVAFGSLFVWVFLSAEIAADFWQMYTGNGSMIKETGCSQRWWRALFTSHQVLFHEDFNLLLK